MVMYKNVNGKKVQLTEEEEKAILAEWKSNEQEKASKAQEMAMRGMITKNKAKGSSVLDKFMMYLAMQEASTDKLKDITKQHMNIYILLQNGALETTLSAIDDVSLQHTLVTEDDFNYLKSLINKELS